MTRDGTPETCQPRVDDLDQHSKRPMRDSRKLLLIEALESYEARLTAYAMRLLNGDLDRARDVVQFAFLKLCEQPIEEMQAKLPAWLYTVIRNRITDDRRLARSSNESLPIEHRDAKQLGPAERAERQEILRQLKRLVAQLPQAQQEIVDLWSHGLKTQDIAEITGMSQGSVRVSLHRAIKSLQAKPSIATWLTDFTPSGSSQSNNSTCLLGPERATGSRVKPVDGGTDASMRESSIDSQHPPKLNGKSNPRIFLTGELS